MTAYRIRLPAGTPIKSGKVGKRKPRLPAGQGRNKHLKAARLAKAWAERSKP